MMRYQHVVVFALLICFNIQISTAQNWSEITKSLPAVHTGGIEDLHYGTSVSVEGDYAVLGAYSYEDSKGIAFVLHHDGSKWVTIGELLAGDGYKGARFGWSVCIDGDFIVVGAPYKSNAGSANYGGAAYVFKKPSSGWTNMTHSAKLVASDEESRNHFGTSVSISGSNVVVGTPKDNDNGYFSGSAYVFTKPSGGWSDMTQTGKLLAGDGAEYDEFGRSVSISGDNILVGAYGNDENGSVSGAAYVFTKPSSGWVNGVHTAKLLASDGASGDYFGWKVGISGDDIVVTAMYDDPLASSSGSAYVFEKPGSVWVDMTQTAKLVPSSGVASESFGYSVDIADNLIVIGAHEDFNNSGSNSGAAFVFKKPTTGWVDAAQDAKLLPSDPDNEDKYGYSVSISNDKVLVGAPQNNEKQSLFGAVYAFTKTSGAWSDITQTEKLQAVFSAGAGGFYGNAVAVDGNYAVVGGYGFESETGIAIVLHYDGSKWVQIAELSADDGDSYENFGQSVSISGDNIVVGADQGDNSVANGSGSVYVFTKPAGGWENMTQTAKLHASDGSGYTFFGWSVAIDQDNIVVGAYRNNTTASYAGAAYVFTMQAGGWVDGTETAKLLASDGTSSDYFGFSVDISGDNIVIGAYGDSQPYSFSGSAYVFSKPAGGWVSATETGKFLPSVKFNNDYFGYSVSISGDNIAIGAYGDRDNAYGAGAVYVFRKPVSGWTNMSETAKLLASDAVESEHLGWSVSISGGTIASGAYGNDDNGEESGSVYIFREPATGWKNGTQDELILATDGQVGDNFGHAVCISGGQLIVGAPEDQDYGKESGSAYLYRNSLIVQADDTQSINDYTLFPNPTSGRVTLLLNQLSNVSIKVVDGIGQLILNDQNILALNYSFDITSSVGVYFVEITSDQATQWIKVIKN